MNSNTKPSTKTKALVDIFFISLANLGIGLCSGMVLRIMDDITPGSIAQIMGLFGLLFFAAIAAVSVGTSRISRATRIRAEIYTLSLFLGIFYTTIL